MGDGRVVLILDIPRPRAACARASSARRATTVRPESIANGDVSGEAQNMLLVPARRRTARDRAVEGRTPGGIPAQFAGDGRLAGGRAVPQADPAAGAPEDVLPERRRFDRYEDMATLDESVVQVVVYTVNGAASAWSLTRSSTSSGEPRPDRRSAARGRARYDGAAGPCHRGRCRWFPERMFAALFPARPTARLSSTVY